MEPLAMKKASTLPFQVKCGIYDYFDLEFLWNPPSEEANTTDYGSSKK